MSGPLDHRDINGGYDPRIKEAVTGDAQQRDAARSPLDLLADAVRAANLYGECPNGRAALAQVEALAEAAQAAHGVLYALQRSGAQSRRRTNVQYDLATALVPFAAHKDTNHA